MRAPVAAQGGEGADLLPKSINASAMTVQPIVAPRFLSRDQAMLAQRRKDLFDSRSGL